MVKELLHILLLTQTLQAGVFGSKCQRGMARSRCEQGRGSEPGRWEENLGFIAVFPCGTFPPEITRREKRR